MIRMQVEENFNQKLRDLEQALRELEDDYAQKEIEIQDVVQENQEL
jgi:hypothetical protein